MYAYGCVTQISVQETARGTGFDVRDDDVARLSPLVHEHINMLGRYAFTLPEPVARAENSGRCAALPSPLTTWFDVSPRAYVGFLFRC